MRSKNYRGGILVAFAALALAACGPEDNTAAPSTPQGPATPPSQTPANVVPAISGSPATTITAGTTYLFQASATDGDGDALTFSAAGLPGWAALNAQTGVLFGTPSEADVGTTSDIVVTVSDGEASVSLPAFHIVIASSAPPPANPPPVTPTNRAPVISGAPLANVQANTSYTFAPNASDADGQTLSFTIINKPTWANFSTTTGAISGTPSVSQVRTYSNIVITVSDGSLSASLPAFAITVSAAPNRAPTITGAPATTGTAGTAYSFTPAGSDPDGQTLTYSVANKPSWAAFNTSTGRLSGTPASTNTGNFANITIIVSDGALSIAWHRSRLPSVPRPTAPDDFRHSGDQRGGGQRICLPTHCKRSRRQHSGVLDLWQARLGDLLHGYRRIVRHTVDRQRGRIHQYRDQRERRHEHPVARGIHHQRDATGYRKRQ